LLRSLGDPVPTLPDPDYLGFGVLNLPLDALLYCLMRSFELERNEPRLELVGRIRLEEGLYSFSETMLQGPPAIGDIFLVPGDIFT